MLDQSDSIRSSRATRRRLAWLTAGLALAMATLGCNAVMRQFAPPATPAQGYVVNRAAPTGTPAPTAAPPPATFAPTPVPAASDWSYDYTPAPIYSETNWAVSSGWLTAGQLQPPADKPLNWKVGEIRTFNYDNGGDERKVKAVVRYITAHFIMLFEQGAQASDADIASAAETAERQIYPDVRRIFGDEWSPGVDGDPHVLVLNLAHLSGDNYGEFSPQDECPVRLCDSSNGHEMIYLSLDGLKVGSDEYLGVLAHEFQHVVRYNTDGADSNWLNEALAVLAETLSGHGRLAGDFIPDFLADPDLPLNQWPAHSADSGPHYGAGYLFTLYLYGRFGESFIHDLAREPQADMAGVAAVLGRYSDESLSQIMGEWAAANLLDNPRLSDGRYGYTFEALPAAALAATHTQFPVQETTDVHQFAADYIALQSAGGLRLTFDGAVETPLLPVKAHSGRRFWWSNRLDNSRAYLQTALDLSGLRAPTASYWMWYDTDPGWDVTTVEVSTDEGASWTVIRGDHSQRDHWWGYMYSGRSGGDVTARWLQESVDLDRWAGRKILLRWEYLTDTAYTGPGFALDDFALQSAAGSGPVQDFESGAPGWTAAGFVYAGDSVRQDWAVYIVTPGSAPQIAPLALDAAGHGEMDAPDSGGHSILVVAASAPLTQELAAYTYKVEARP